jgi:hypothetical protein
MGKQQTYKISELRILNQDLIQELQSHMWASVWSTSSFLGGRTLHAMKLANGLFNFSRISTTVLQRQAPNSIVRLNKPKSFR